MSTDYTDTLKKIKETEEASSREILERRKALEEGSAPWRRTRQPPSPTPRSAATSTWRRRSRRPERPRQKGADALLAKTAKEASVVASKKLDKKDLKKIIDNSLFSEFK